MKLSVIILTKNEEKNIEECLETLVLIKEKIDEIIIVDDYSEDRTIEKIQNSSANWRIKTQNKNVKFKIYQKLLKENFADQHNFAMTKASADWLLYLDADERITPELAESIKREVLGKKNSNFSAYKIRRKNFYFGDHEWPYVEKLERLFRKKNLKGWYGELHESSVIEGKTGELNGFLFHYTHRNLSSMLVKTIAWSKIEAELRLKADHPKMTWWRFPKLMTGEFFNYYFKQRGFKTGVVGLIESLYQAFSIFITYARLWELQQKGKRE